MADTLSCCELTVSRKGFLFQATHIRILVQNRMSMLGERWDSISCLSQMPIIYGGNQESRLQQGETG